MSLNRVSFGKVVDIYYRYNSKYPEIREKAEKKQYEASRAYRDSLAGCGYEMLSNFDTATNVVNKKLYEHANRIITGDDYLVYNHLYKIEGKEVAKKYADNHAEKYTVDIY